MAEQFFHIGRVGVDGLNIADALCGGVVVFAVALDLNGSQQSGNVLFDAAPQVFKHDESFTFVFLFRIFLSIAAQMDALAQVVHGGEVFAPLVVDNLQHNVAFEIRHGLFADQFDFLGIFIFDAFDETLFNVLVVQSTVFFQPAFNIDMQAEIGGKLVLKCRNVPLLFHAVRRNVVINQIADNVGANFASQIADVFSRQDFVALMVNHFTLVVGNVIVFQNLFTHIEVAAFDFTLRAFDLTGQQAVFDGNAAFGCQTVKDGGSTVESKEAQ